MAQSHFKGPLARAILLLFLLCGLAAAATDVTVIGVFPNRAVVQINGGAPRTLAVGQKSAEGVSLVAVDRDGATLDIDGRRRTLKLGQHHASATSDANARVSVAADPRGHFLIDGVVNGGLANGGPVRFVVDTGATVVSLSADDAARIGLNYRDAPIVRMRTANGIVDARRVVLRSVRVGDVSIDNVEAAVVPMPGMPALLGMSFLNRMNMRREGDILTLTKRF